MLQKSTMKLNNIFFPSIICRGYSLWIADGFCVKPFNLSYSRNIGTAHGYLSENSVFQLSEIWDFHPTAATQPLLKNQRVARLCEVSPYSERYGQSLPLYKSETLEEKSLLHVFLLSFQSPNLSNPILSNPPLNLSDYWNPEPRNAWSPMKCRCLQPESSCQLCTFDSARFHIYFCHYLNFAST